MEKRKMKLNIIGPYFGTSGYVNHVKGLAKALNKIVDVKISTQLIPNWNLLCDDEDLTMIKKEDDKDRINVIIDMPFNWTVNLYKKINIGFLVFEGDKIPLSWVDRISDKRINQVWVPSIHTYNAIKNTLTGNIVDKNISPNATYHAQILMQKIKIVPHGIDLSLFKPDKKNKQGFTFLVNKGFRNELDRGGMQHVIRAFIQEFNKGEAKLMLKINSAYCMPLEQLHAIITRYIQEARKNPGTIGEIDYTYENLTQKQLADLYNSCDVLVNSTHAEAFSLPSLEALGCGIPVISTNYGGQIDFLKDSNSWLINYEMKEVTHEILYEGISQAEPNIEDLRKAMRISWENREMLTQKAINGSNEALNWSWSNSAEKAIQYIKECQAEQN